MSYTTKELGDGFYEITTEINGEQTIFNICVASEDQIDEVVNFRVADLIAGDQEPIITYVEKRIAEYPPISDQLDYIYHNGIDAWKTDIIQPIKDKFPKT